ncbi:hypothetical protein OIU84_019923 [Salix udensis]|uniref:MIF4G domain-containing protein n=1 Tax=Salix udensis TaxID=889485 RepID=A0AAD6L044_9ROSI|nr:hypothetical protein OIU84_019923 [Salix udensis]
MDHHEDESRGGSETHRNEDDEEAAARQEEMKKSIEAKVALRQSNLNPDRPGLNIKMGSMLDHFAMIGLSRRLHADAGGDGSRLPGCVSRDLIDQLTVEFCYLNSKSNRKRLVRALFNVPRTSLELLPYYSRMVATLSTCMKDVSFMLLQMLEEEFNFLINKKDQMNIETKIRNIRFIGELCKFRIAPASTVFSLLEGRQEEPGT